MNNKQIAFSVTGRYALFTNPINKLCGEKFSYPVPTYEALRGVVSNIYWKPTILWKIDKVKVIKPIRTFATGKTPRIFAGTEYPYTISYYTYLADVEYHVLAHYVFNHNQVNMLQDCDYGKHNEIVRHALKVGGRRNVFLGLRECQADVAPIEWTDEPEGYYKDRDEISFGMMFHSYLYPEESGENKLYKRLWSAKMRHGIIDFTDPSIKLKEIFVRPMKAKIFENKYAEASE